MLGLPEDWQGVLQDTASTATLVSIISAREKKSGWNINRRGFGAEDRYAIYCSEQAHSSVDKAVRISGIGNESLRKIPVDQNFALNPQALEKAIKLDLENGLIPLMVIATIGTTGTTAVDPLPEITTVCQEHQLWVHVDAAWAGTAMILPDYRWMISGLENADSFVFNPHKWMFTNFDCSAYFVRDRAVLTKTFSVVPEYLKTNTREVNNYSEWGIQLGRRFRALKLWFVIRNFGVQGLKDKIRSHIQWAKELAAEIDHHPDFQLMLPAPLGCVCFRYRPAGRSESSLNTLNRKLLETINSSGKLYLTHTKLDERFVIRLVVGQTYQTRDHIFQAWSLIQDLSNRLVKN